MREGAQISVIDRFEVASGPSAAAGARRALERLHDRVDQQTYDDLRLLITELVTNSSRHAGLSPGSPIQIEVAAEADCVHVIVRDHGRGFDPRGVPEPGPASGWGLKLIERLARRWGINGRDGTTVWFELKTTSARQATVG